MTLKKEPSEPSMSSESVAQLRTWDVFVATSLLSNEGSFGDEQATR